MLRSPPATGAGHGGGGGGRHDNQDGDDADTGGSVLPDVSQHGTVLADQEEDVHFQVKGTPGRPASSWSTQPHSTMILFLTSVFLIGFYLQYI